MTSVIDELGRKIFASSRTAPVMSAYSIPNWLTPQSKLRSLSDSSLGRAGFQIWESASAEDALQRLDGGLPGVMVVDWMLPGMSGVDLARRLRRDPHLEMHTRGG